MLAAPDPRLLAALLALVRQQAGAGLTVIGLCGAQGAGKSTLVAALAGALEDGGLPTAVLSLDDLYRTRRERQRLAAQVHPLLLTRGVPGTHDIALGLAVVAALERGEAAALPRFDKAADDRAAERDWPAAAADTRVLLLEGWCLGARPQAAAALVDPVNPLEAQEDPGGIWRGYANAALAGEYQLLFARLDALVLLAAPGWDVVARWREQQEAELRARSGPAAAGVMTPDQVTRFIAHYERLTRHILAEMPPRADLLVRLGAAREVLALTRRNG
ncbi:kinase [Novosphingobium sp.]|uniref:kinase n=1 Tax=Novosphingobium sp. TaxID=1874826 RepID=UPI00273331E3|nr:kinase [Novosphingobium sp.]MDP3908449.1 kinase [Novosphingobium sp.]